MKILTTLTLIFAALKYFGQIDWEWIAVVAPILIGQGFKLAYLGALLMKAYVILIAGSAEAAERWCARLEKHLNDKYDAGMTSVAGLRKVFEKRWKGKVVSRTA